MSEQNFDTLCAACNGDRVIIDLTPEGRRAVPCGACNPLAAGHVNVTADASKGHCAEVRRLRSAMEQAVSYIEGPGDVYIRGTKARDTLRRALNG